jgi:hypothetical protein
MPVAADRLALMPALLFGWDRSGGLGAQRRRGMQRARPPKASWRYSGSWSAGAHSGPAHNRLAGANRTAVDGLARNERGTAGRQSGPWRLRLYLTRSRTRLLQPGHHVGTRRNYGTRRGLPRQIVARLWPQRCSRRRHRRRSRHRRRRRFGRRGSAGWWSSPRHGSSRNCNRRRGRHGRRGRSRRYGLSRSRQDLTGTRRRNGTGRNRTSAQRGMQRSHATCGQGRPQGRRLTAKRFFNDGNGGLLGSGWDG